MRHASAPAHLPAGLHGQLLGVATNGSRLGNGRKSPGPFTVERGEQVEPCLTSSSSIMPYGIGPNTGFATLIPWRPQKSRNSLFWQPTGCVAGGVGHAADRPPRFGPVGAPFRRRDAGGQSVAQTLDVQEPLVGLLGQTAEHDRDEVGGQLGPDPRRRLDGVTDVSHHNGEHARRPGKAAGL